MNTQTLRLDVSKRDIASQIVRIGQGDSGGTTIVAKIYDNGEELDLTGMSANFEMRLPDTTLYVRDVNCEIDGNTITYVVDEDYVASVSGTTDVAYFDIIDGSDVIASTTRFTVDVLKSAHDGAIPASSWDNAVDELIERGNAVIEDMEESCITSATATVDANVGTPTVEVSLGEKTALGRAIAFIFHNIKGNPGNDGSSGTITSVTASVDANVGTPSVDVSLGGTSLARTIAFAFHNIKGAKGDTVSVEPISTSQIDTVVADGTVSSDLEALTGAGLTYLWGKLKTKFAALVNGAVAIAQGGTGATTAANARKNLGTPASSSIATVEQSTATASHAKNSHFMLDGELRKATSAIASGESITNSNSTTDTLQGQIDTLQDSVALYDLTQVAFTRPDDASGERISMRFRRPDGSHIYIIFQTNANASSKVRLYDDKVGENVWSLS